ncbi:MAG TPA: sigma-70 family RNA polymerase sigma factor [Polyangiaceae bacterium]|jgi:RNA polymerase sigma-70 factor (ECF subfamily)|nr:sigma-70 family RNA polymerase sigma factor [Polyangiaceae bacterium]
MTPADENQCDPERLLELWRSDDRAGLDQLTRCYGARLLVAGRRHCRTSSEAEDAVQDALLLAAEGLDGLRSAGSLEGYLVKVVARACRRHSRGHKNDVRAHDSEYVVIGSDEDPEAQAARSEIGAILDKALLELDPEDRVLLLLGELEDYSALEIGARLGLSEGAVRTRASRLRKWLRSVLAPELEQK